MMVLNKQFKPCCHSNACSGVCLAFLSMCGCCRFPLLVLEFVGVLSFSPAARQNHDQLQETTLKTQDTLKYRPKKETPCHERKHVLGFKGVPTSGLRRVYFKHYQHAGLKPTDSLGCWFLSNPECPASSCQDARCIGVSPAWRWSPSSRSSTSAIKPRTTQALRPNKASPCEAMSFQTHHGEK